MAAAAPSPLASSVEKTNGAKLSRLLIDGGTTVLRNVFDGFHPPALLAANLNANYLTLNHLYKKKVLHKPQWDLLFPPGGATPDSNTFDITLLFLLLANICGLSPPPSGWHKQPPSSDTSLEANLARIKLYRNELYGHVTSTGVTTAAFNKKWQEIRGVLVALGLNSAEVTRLKAAPCGEDYISAVIEWVKSEKEIKSQLAEVRKTQHEARQRQEEDHKTLQDTHKVVEDLRQIHQDTHQVVDEIWTGQQELYQKQEQDHRTLQDTHQTVEDVRQIHQDTHQVVEKIWTTQQEAHKKQQKDHGTLQDTHKAVEDVRQIQQDTHQVVEEIWTTQQEVQRKQQEDHGTLQNTHQAVEEVVKTQKKTLETLQQVNEKVEKMKERSNGDKDDEMLRKLAEVNSQKVIEDHAEKYQEGTRQFFFESVEKWLDDRSSPNRVMVISGTAGMGKSVIAAVICKRMQAAGRLSGSHFCQHDKARYRNPKVMLQSLACQLSHSLPEYKETLVKTLSGNLGVELNNMEVKDLFELLFDELLSKLKDPGRNILLVIGGLDESEYQGRNELLDVISNHFIKLPRWIRLVVTTRPEINIADSLKSFNPLLLEPSDTQNLLDMKLLFEKRLSGVIPQDHQEVIVNNLVKKSEGLILYANLLVHFIKENGSLLTPEELDSTLPSGISSVYQTHFKRLEGELHKELMIKEEQFLIFLSALTAAREPLLLDFVSKLMLSGTSSSADYRRKVKKAIACISTLLPVRDDRIHFFHKSVKDWLTDTSWYGQHDFTVDETKGHRILSKLCTHELDDIKRNGVDGAQLSGAAKYALRHGVQHMLHLEDDFRASEVVLKYVVDLELVYGKLCVFNAGASEDILSIQTQKLFQVLSEDSKGMLNTLMFLLRKYYDKFRTHPEQFFQTVLNEGGTALSPLASNLLLTKYPEIAYMELMHKQTQQGALIARFQCSSQVACFDVSPQLDYLVCECKDGTIQLWSLHTGKQVWVRPVIVLKNGWDDVTAFKKSPSSPVLSCYRSVVFHPQENIVLPGILSHAYTFDGDLKTLFPQSPCRFTVCSISGDKTTMLTDCPDDAKCIIMWSLKNGTEITRTTRNDGVLSFAWSPDGRLLAISHSSGLICFVDVRDEFRTVAEHYFEKNEKSKKNDQVCGMIRFSPDCRSLFCCCEPSDVHQRHRKFRLNVNIAEHPSCTLDDSSGLSSWELESPCVAGFLLGDPLFLHFEFNFALDTVTVLRVYPYDTAVDMLNINELQRTVEKRRPDVVVPPLLPLPDTLAPVGMIPQSRFSVTNNVAFSLTGETVYVVSTDWRNTIATCMAWDVLSEEPVGQVGTLNNSHLEARIKEGVLLSTAEGCLDMWNFKLSNCIRRWPDLVQPTEITQIIPISEERVALSSENKVTVLNTITSEIVSIPIDHGEFVTCNSKCQLLTRSYSSYQLLDGQTTLWKIVTVSGTRISTFSGTFSPCERFVVLYNVLQRMLVLDALSGRILQKLLKRRSFLSADCQFVSDEECVILSGPASGGCTIELFNVESGVLLSAIDLEREMRHLAVCPRKRLLAIDQKDSKLGVELIQVHLPRDKDSRKNKR